MNKNIIIATTIAGILLPANSAFAAKVLNDKLEIYGKVHLSIDSSDRDDPSITNDGIGISSNSSRLGFKGQLPAGDFKFIYQVESEIRFDEGSSGSTLAGRNTYAGLKGGFGQIILGQYDTPFKTVASKWGLFGDSVGERRAILGASYSDGNQLNERAKNAIMYTYKTRTLRLDMMYANDPEKGTSGATDNTDKNMFGIGLRYKSGPLWLGVATESWEGQSKAGNVDALRVAAKYKFGMAQIGAFYETIDSDNKAQWKRDATGLNAKFKISKKTDIRAQYLVVDDADGTTDTGATKISLGIFHKLDNKAQVYIAYGSTDNDANAKFQAVDGGHGDEVKTANGGNPTALSLGLIYKF